MLQDSFKKLVKCEHYRQNLAINSVSETIKEPYGDQNMYSKNDSDNICFFLPKVDSWGKFGLEAKWNTWNPCHNYVYSVDMTSPGPRKFVKATHELNTCWILKYPKKNSACLCFRISGTSCLASQSSQINAQMSKIEVETAQF